MPDFTQYQPPGVYVEEGSTPLVSVLGSRPTTVAIVGPSIGYRTHTEAVKLNGTTPVILAKLGIAEASIRITQADGTLINGANYSVTVGAGADANQSATLDNTISIARNGSGIADGATVYVTYRYTDADYYEPVRAQDYDDVKDFFGEPFNLTTGAILSPLSLAAKIAFENGASQLLLVATAGDATVTDRQELTDAYTKLAALYDVNVVVPLPVGISGSEGSPGDVLNVGNDLLSHVNTASNDGLFRIGIIGFEQSVSVLPATAARTFNSQRVVLAFPNKLTYYNGFTNQNIEVSGYYLAAAYAGRIAGQDVQLPLTAKAIRGFSGLPASVLGTMTKSAKDAWSDAGVAVTEVSRDGVLMVRHGTTTRRDNVNTRELSLVRARDTLVTMIQDTTERAELIGTPIEEDTPLRVKGVIAGVLETAVSNRVIVGYNDLKVRQRVGDPSVVEVKFQYRPAYPLNYIVVSFSINTSTGETTVLDEAA